MRVRILILLALAGLAGCETMQGLGRDVEAGGEAIQETAVDAQY